MALRVIATSPNLTNLTTASNPDTCCQIINVKRYQNLGLVKLICLDFSLSLPIFKIALRCRRISLHHLNAIEDGDGGEDNAGVGHDGRVRVAGLASQSSDDKFFASRDSLRGFNLFHGLRHVLFVNNRS